MEAELLKNLNGQHGRQSDTESCTLEWRQTGELFFKTSRDSKKVFVKRCFPWSEPWEYLSLRDENEKEIHLIEKMDDLDRASRQALLRALTEVGFCFRVTDVIMVDEEFELRLWRVKTQQGERSFQTALTDWPYQMPDGALFIKDVHGDIYLIEDPKGLPDAAQKKLWAFID